MTGEEIYMEFKKGICPSVFLMLLALGATSFILKESQASESYDLEFEVIDSGDLSGYCEEEYLVIKTEVEWTSVWEKHTVLCMHLCTGRPPCPNVDFSEKTVICVFMGERPTLGYDISIESIWVEEERVHVDVVKRSPPKEYSGGQALTYPFMLVSLEKADFEVVFHVTEETGTDIEFSLPEFPTMTFTLTLLVMFSVAMVAFMRKFRR